MGCAALLVLGIAFDMIGFALLLLGVFANLRLDGRFYGDLLIYSGSLMVFLSLFWWVMWYTGNITASSEDLEKRTFDSFPHWARKVSESLSRSARKPREDGEKCTDTMKKPTRITWENSGTEGCINAAYERSSGKKTVELQILKNRKMFGKQERVL